MEDGYINSVEDTSRQRMPAFLTDRISMLVEEASVPFREAPVSTELIAAPTAEFPIILNVSSAPASGFDTTWTNSDLGLGVNSSRITRVTLFGRTSWRAGC